MSQTYVIKVSASVQETVQTGDRRVKRLVLTGIVPEDEQREILRQALRREGWEEAPESAGQVYTREREGVRETIDLEAMTVEVALERAKTVERQRSILVRGDRDFEDPEVRRQREQAELARSLQITAEEKARVERSLQREIADALDAGEAERSRELNELVREVYAESLKRKAARLGSIQEVREGRDGQDYELVIRITE